VYCCPCPCTSIVPQEGEYQESGDAKDIFPDFVKMAEAFNVPGKRVMKPEELRCVRQRKGGKGGAVRQWTEGGCGCCGA